MKAYCETCGRELIRLANGEYAPCPHHPTGGKAFVAPTIIPESTLKILDEIIERVNKEREEE